MAGQTLVVSVLADTKKFSDGIGSVGKVAAGVFAVAGAAVIGFAALAVKAAGEAEKVAAQTTAVLNSTGGAAGRTADEISKLSTNLSRMSGIDDEVVQSGANVLLTFTKIQGANFDKATEAALNMSVALGKDLNSSATLVGKALNDPIKGVAALSKSGVQFTESQKATIASLVELGDVAGAQTVILQELETQFGGSAEAFGNTFEGSIGRVKTAFGNLQESIGSTLLPVLTILNNQAADFLNKLTDSAGFQAFLGGISSLAQGVLDGTVSFGSILPAIQGGIQAAANWLQYGGITGIVNAIIAGREAFFAAALQVFPVLVDAVVAVVPQLVEGVISLVTSLVSVLVSSAPTLLAGAVTLFLGLVQGAITILPTLITQVVGLLPVIVTALVAAIPVLLEGAIQLFSSLIDAVVTILPDLIVQIIEMLPGIIAALIGLIPQLIEGAISLFMAIVMAIPKIIPVLIQAIIDLIPILIDTVLGLIPVLLDAAVELFLAIIDAIPIIIPALINAIPQIVIGVGGALIGAIPKIIDAGIKLFGGLFEAVNQIVPGLINAGGQLVAGLWDGIANAWAGFMSWWNSTVAGVVDTVKTIFGIASPSKVFAGLGKNIVQGLEKGLGGPNQLDSLMSGLADQVTGGFDARLAAPNGYRSGFGNTYLIEVNPPVGMPSAEIGRELVSHIDAYERKNGHR